MTNVMTDINSMLNDSAKNILWHITFQSMGDLINDVFKFNPYYISFLKVLFIPFAKKRKPLKLFLFPNPAACTVSITDSPMFLLSSDARTWAWPISEKMNEMMSSYFAFSLIKHFWSNKDFLYTFIYILCIF